MRPSCLKCVRKHLGQAEANMTEVLLGYGYYRGLAIGHLAEAAAESVQGFPDLADEIREHWKRYEEDSTYPVPTHDLLQRVEGLLADGAQRERKKPDRKRRRR